MKCLILFLLSAVSLLGANETDAIRSAAVDWTQAVVKQDRAALERLLADDLEFAHPGGMSQTKAEYIISMTDGPPSYDALTPRDFTIHVYDNTAVLAGYLDAKPRGSEATAVRFTQLYVESKGQWQLASSLATSLRVSGGNAQRRMVDPAGAVRDVAVDWTKAVVRQDKATLEGLLTNDLYFALADGKSTLTKAEYIASILESPVSYEAFTFTGDVTIHVHDNTAVLSGYVDAKPRGREPNTVRFMQLYAENNGQWQLAASGATDVRAPGGNTRRGAREAGDAAAAAAVRDTALAWTQAVVAEDHATLQRLLTDDLIFGHSGGRPFQNKQEFITSDENSDYEALPLRDIRIRVYGKTAVLSSYFDTKHKGRPTSPVKTLQIFRENNGQWQLAAFQSARINPPENSQQKVKREASPGAIRAVQDAAAGWTQAMVKRDRAALEPLLAADLIFVHSNGSTIQNQAQYLAASEKSTYEGLPLSNIASHIYGRTAVLTAYIDTKNVGRDPFRVRTFQVFVENNGQWQLAAFQSTRVSP